MQLGIVCVVRQKKLFFDGCTCIVNILVYLSNCTSNILDIFLNKLDNLWFMCSLERHLSMYVKMYSQGCTHSEILEAPTITTYFHIFEIYLLGLLKVQNDQLSFKKN